MSTDDTARALDIFQREGVVVVRGLLPSPVTERTAASLRCGAPITHGQFPLDIRMAENMRAIPRFLHIHPLLFDLLGCKRLFCHWPPMARAVHPLASEAAVPAHQDVAYNRHIDGPFVTLWAPLVPIDRDCGGMAVYPRSHLLGELPVGEGLYSRQWLPPARDFDADSQIVLEPMDAGDAVIMAPWLVHESMPNVSKRVRLSCDFRFFGEGTKSSKHRLDIAMDEVVAP